MPGQHTGKAAGLPGHGACAWPRKRRRSRSAVPPNTSGLQPLTECKRCSHQRQYRSRMRFQHKRRPTCSFFICSCISCTFSLSCCRKPLMCSSAWYGRPHVSTAQLRVNAQGKTRGDLFGGKVCLFSRHARRLLIAGTATHICQQCECLRIVSVGYIVQHWKAKEIRFVTRSNAEHLAMM